MAETENIYDIWWWVSKVISSCEDVDHINAAERLVENYRRMFNDPLLTSKLRAELDYKIEELIGKLDV
jgi:hypothetical protein